MDKCDRADFRRNITSRERLIMALDVPNPDSALELVERLGDAVQFYKIGLELFITGHFFKLLDELRERNKKIFVDLKFFDIPETVRRAVAQLSRHEITFATVHGNDGMMRAAVEAKNSLRILAVTSLTSLDRGDLDDLGFECDVEQLVLSRATRATKIGCDGVIASGLEARQLRAALGDGLIIVTPGIRPVSNDDDQKRVVTVQQAFSNGADYVVIGRPIRDAQNPRKAAVDIQQQIANVFRPEATPPG